MVVVVAESAQSGAEQGARSAQVNAHNHICSQACIGR